MAEAIDERKREANLRNIFDEMDENGDGELTEDEFVRNYFLVDSTLNEEQVRKIFKEADHDGAGKYTLLVHHFVGVAISIIHFALLLSNF